MLQFCRRPLSEGLPLAPRRFTTGLPDNLLAGYDPGMRIVLPALGVAFAALCIWLAVRIINRRERWARWTLALVGVPSLYLASFGPACWLTDAGVLPIGTTGTAFLPLIRLSERSVSVRENLRKYAEGRREFSKTGWRLLCRPWPPKPQLGEFSDMDLSVDLLPPVNSP